jgi:hypothetical protein
MIIQLLPDGAVRATGSPTADPDLTYLHELNGPGLERINQPLPEGGDG